jgi:HprK-related kinase A
MRHQTAIRVGPVSFRIGSAWRAPIAALDDLYRDYPAADGVPDYTVRLEPPRPWRRVIRPQVGIAGDFTLPEAVPLPLAHGLLAAEMGMNLQMALGHRRHLLLHAASVERDGAALLMTGESGAGKSTLSALLATRGWRFMGDEFALIAPATGLAHPFPRPVSLKNESIATVAWPGARSGPVLVDTPKGTIRHLAPDPASLAAMDRPARPALLIFPRFGHAAAVRAVGAAEAFVRLTEASTNYVALGEAGFAALTRLVREVPAVAVDYPDGASGIAAVEALWAAR